jgi:glucose-1-phosphate cytidylyltransferase
MKVVILAGGFGTRLSEETDFIPKPMALIGRKPILWHLIKFFQYYGLNSFIICSGYKSEIIKKYFIQKKNIPNKADIKVIFTGKKSNTGERIFRIRDLINDKNFIMTYGDGLSNVNIKKLLNFHYKNNTVATLTGVRPEPRFGRIQIKKNLVKTMLEKKNKQDDWINGGFMVCKKDIFRLFKKKNSIFESDILNKLIKKKQLSAFQHKGFWRPIDTLRDKREVNRIWNKGKAPWKIW